MSLNEIRCLPSCGSTNTYAKEHIEEFGPVAAVYTTSQTSGRGRLGRLWTNAAGQALYYTAVLKVPMVQPETSGPTTCCWGAKRWWASSARR